MTAGVAAGVAAAGRELRLPSYGVTIASGALARIADIARAAAPAHRYAVVTDETVGPLYAVAVTRALGHGAELFTIPAGEASKTRETWAALTDAMLAAGLGRDTTVVAVGGGVVGDLAGFVAATYLRGVPIVQVPTSLLAMVDASVGGKVGVDTPAGKNLVGAFHQPAAVVIDPEVLRTLPLAHRRAGLAEILKHGIIADECYFAEVEAQLETLRGGLTGADPASAAAADDDGHGDLHLLAATIARSVEIKSAVVTADERESGVRKTLNFGHMIGHAIEQLSAYTLLHGEAIAIGMVAEAGLGERLGATEPGTASRIERAVRDAGLPARVPGEMTAPAILEATRSDKKARAGAVEYALPRRIGAMAGGERGWSVRANDSDVLAALAAVRAEEPA